MSLDKATVMIEDFSGGIDRRQGIVNRDTSKCYDMENYQITPGKKVKRRVSCVLLGGDLATSNSFYINGYLTAFLPYGAAPINSVAGLDVPTRIIYYDLPPKCLGDDDVIFASAISSNPVAIIRHTDSNGYDVLYVHVFDELDNPRTHFSYISDGAAPSFWNPLLPQHPYGTDRPGVPVFYDARMIATGGQVIVSLSNGDHAYSAVLRPRVFNERTALQILQDGRWWYILGVVTGTNTAYIDIPAQYIDANFFPEMYQQFGLEVLDTTGTWVSRTVTVAAATVNTVSAALLTFDGTGYAGRPFRFFARAKPIATIVSGLQLQADGSISTGTISYKGAIVQVPGINPTLFYTGTIVSAGAPITAFYGFDPDTFAYFWSRTPPTDNTVIVAMAQFSFSTGAFLSGTITFASTAVTGSGTSFTTDFSVGDYIYINHSAGTRKITAIADDTHLTLEVKPQTPLAGGLLPSSYQYAKASHPTMTLPGTYGTTVGSNLLTVENSTLKIYQLLNTTVTAGSETRRVTGLSASGSSANIMVDSAFTVTAAGLTVSYQPTYVYNYALGASGSAFYAAREAEAILLAGDGDAGQLTSSQYDTRGTVSLSIAAVQNRIFFQYPHAVQMWEIVPTLQIKYLAKQEIGAGSIPHPIPVILDDGVMLPTVFGPRLFLPYGNGKDYITYSPFGDRINSIGLPQFQAAAWWQEQSVFVTAGTGSDPTLWVLSFNKEDKIFAWSRWTIATLPRVDRLIVGGGTLMIISGTKVYQFRPASTVFKDEGLDGDTPYTSRIRGLYTDLSKPRNNKRLTRFDLQQSDGTTSTLNVYVSAEDTSDSAMATTAPIVVGNTQGSVTYPLAIKAPVLAYEITSTDINGHQLNAIGFDYLLTKR